MIFLGLAPVATDMMVELVDKLCGVGVVFVL